MEKMYASCGVLTESTLQSQPDVEWGALRIPYYSGLHFRPKDSVATLKVIGKNFLWV